MADAEVDATLTRGSTGWARTAAVLYLPLLLLGGCWLLLGIAGPANAAAYPPLTGGINGPSIVGLAQKAGYVVNAAGGPAEAANGSQVGIYSYKASILAFNTTGAIITPNSGVLINQTVKLSFIAPNQTESVTIYVAVTSSLSGTNVTQNFSFVVQILQPYRFQATLVVGTGSSISAFSLTISLDGVAVGSVSVPTLTAGATFPVSFAYVTSSLGPGWHTFSMNLAQEHGLVGFAGGGQQYSSSFFIPGSPPDNTIWYLAGISAFVGAILIFMMGVGARRRGRPKK